MTTFGSNFLNCPVPLAFNGRYFILEPSTPAPLMSVVLEHNGVPVFEILRNEPNENPLSAVTKTPPGIITVSDEQTGRFLYKVRPDSDTSVVFGMLRGEELEVIINDREIRIGITVFRNNAVSGFGAGTVIDENGGIGMGAPIPEGLLQLFR
jgi:hypothetical protein